MNGLYYIIEVKHQNSPAKPAFSKQLSAFPASKRPSLVGSSVCCVGFVSCLFIRLYIDSLCIKMKGFGDLTSFNSDSLATIDTLNKLTYQKFSNPNGVSTLLCDVAEDLFTPDQHRSI